MKTNRITLISSHGFTLVEMLVALGISMFMILVMVKIFTSATDVTKTQDALSQLQQKERLAMTIIKDTINSAGYYPNVTTNTRSSTFPASTPYPVGVTLFGVDGASASAPDTLRTRFQTANNDGVMNCQGGSNTSGTNQLYDNVITLDPVHHLLECSLGINGATPGTPQPLIDGIDNIKFLYGVDTKGSGSADQYVTATNVTNWTNVRSVLATLTFINPLTGLPDKPVSITVQVMD